MALAIIATLAAIINAGASRPSLSSARVLIRFPVVYRAKTPVLHFLVGYLVIS